MSAPRRHAGLFRSRSLQAALVAVVVGLAAVIVPLSAKGQRAGPVAPVAVSAVTDGLNHFVVQTAGSSVAPSANDQDPIVLAPGKPKGEYLARLARLERELPAADLGSVYRAPDGTVRLHLLSASPRGERHRALIAPEAFQGDAVLVGWSDLAAASTEIASTWSVRSGPSCSQRCGVASWDPGQNTRECQQGLPTRWPLPRR
ncbi:MAG: hypothetical protein M0004_11020 [Actinomycetota bacterium]|nr:hypothetical protein [Actinomycetota bacterium]